MARVTTGEKRENGAPRPTRRDFCARACQAASFVTLGALAQRCGGGGGGNPAGPSGPPASALPVVNAGIVNGAVTIAVANTPLAAVGGAALVRSSRGDLLVTRTGPDTFSALTATCTHESCTINGFRNEVFVCPCHGSQFNTSGAVLNGPATRPLAQFAAGLDGDTLRISV